LAIPQTGDAHHEKWARVVRGNAAFHFPIARTRHGKPS
jgi:hypothetical protein